MVQKLISQGAEAKIFLDKDKDLIIKDRVSKSYRHPELDKKLRKRRTKSEKKILNKALEVVNVPGLQNSEQSDKIYMDCIKGERLSEYLGDLDLEKQKEIMAKIGSMIAKIHSKDIIHGDLTTSNFILSPSEEVYIIDFGLGYFSKKSEDKAVDLRLFKQAIEAKHFENCEELFEQVLESYKNTFKEGPNKVMERFKRVERRRRYKSGS